MAETTPESQMDVITLPDEPPDLQYANRKYEGNNYFAEREQLLLDRLNAVWKRICASLKLFHVTATAGQVVYACKDNDYDDILEAEYTVKLNLTCKLFTADLKLVYTENIHGSHADYGDHDIRYKLENMAILHKSTILQPLVLDSSKKVYQTSMHFRADPNHESELMECMFVPYDIINSLRRLLICNKVLVAAGALRKLKHGEAHERIPDDIKGFIFRSYRKLSEESANELLRSLLLECRPQWVVPERMEYIRRNTLSNPEMVNRVYPHEK
jgi:hypothetical protein